MQLVRTYRRRSPNDPLMRHSIIALSSSAAFRPSAGPTLQRQSRRQRTIRASRQKPVYKASGGVFSTRASEQPFRQQQCYHPCNAGQHQKEGARAGAVLRFTCDRLSCIDFTRRCFSSRRLARGRVRRPCFSCRWVFCRWQWSCCKACFTKHAPCESAALSRGFAGRAAGAGESSDGHCGF